MVCIGHIHAPFLLTVLSIPTAKKRTETELGITDALKPFRAFTNLKRRVKRKVGYESEEGRLIRNGLPRPGGYLVTVVIGVGVLVAVVAVMAN